jgi:hypothetical protein
VSSSVPGFSDQSAVDSRRRRIIRYVLEHPELDVLQTTGELTFLIGSHSDAGRLTVTAMFRACTAIADQERGAEPVGVSLDRISDGERH